MPSEWEKDRGRKNNLCYSVMLLGSLATLPRLNAMSQSGLIVPLRWKFGLPTEAEYLEYLNVTSGLAFYGFLAFWAALGYMLFRHKPH